MTNNKCSTWHVVANIQTIARYLVDFSYRFLNKIDPYMNMSLQMQREIKIIMIDLFFIVC